MGNKPKINIKYGPDRPVKIEAAYFFLRGFDFFLTNSVRSFGGVASIRRASSSRDICSCVSFFAMGEVYAP